MLAETGILGALAFGALVEAVLAVVGCGHGLRARWLGDRRADPDQGFALTAEVLLAGVTPRTREAVT